MAGRPRKPDELHILDGTFRADRHGDPAASIVAGGTPQPPPHLAGVALDFWREVVSDLIDSGVAKARDTAELTMLCEWWARYRKLSEAVDEGGGNLIHLAIASDKFNAIAARFGLSPSDRAKLRAPEKKSSGVASRKRG